MQKKRIIDILSVDNAKKEIVVDLYTGIGYFSVPIIKLAKNIEHIHCAEINPDALFHLENNMKLNHIPTSKYTIHAGDNRTNKTLHTTVANTADRVLLGLIPSSEEGWPLALRLLKVEGGWMHIHANFIEKKQDEYIQQMTNKLNELIAQLQDERKKPWTVYVHHVEHVKNYAPHVIHAVIDVRVGLISSSSPVSSLSKTIHSLPPTTPVHIYDNPSFDDFWNSIFPLDKPCVLRNVDIGRCVSKWNNEYLSSLHVSELVSVHVCPETKMDFVNRNFIFKTMTFNEMIQRMANNNVQSKLSPESINNASSSTSTSKSELSSESSSSSSSSSPNNNYFISPSERLYLRSIGQNPRKEVSDFRLSFPSLSCDFTFPSYLNNKKHFSSVFRVSSPDIQLWTHYDITDNFLCHITGRKRVLLFPPTQCNNLYLNKNSNSSSSPILDVDNVNQYKYPNFIHARSEAMEVILEPGDILFIPALWFHNVLSLSMCISVNIFWRELPDNFYQQKDLYGNRDLTIGSDAIDSANSIIENLQLLPQKYQEFYMQRTKNAFL